MATVGRTPVMLSCRGGASGEVGTGYLQRGWHTAIIVCGGLGDFPCCIFHCFERVMRVCRVTWLDATGGVRSGWRPLKALMEPPAKVVSVGFLLKQDDVIVLVPHMTGDEGDGEICIPSQWVQEIVDLEPARKKK